MEPILLIDDDRISLGVLSAILTKSGYPVERFTDAERAIERFTLGGISAVVTDLCMPGTNGETVVQELKKRYPDTPVLVITATTEVDVIIRLFKLGADDYLVRPIVPDELLHRVGKAISDTTLRRQILAIEEERRLLELESRKLVNWRMLYAYKDNNQTQQLVNLLNRTNNANGGFGWIDLLAGIPRNPEGGITLDKDILQLVLDSATRQRRLFDFLHFIHSIPKMKMDIQTLSARQILVQIAEFARNDLVALCGRHRHDLLVSVPRLDLEATFRVDLDLLRKSCKELVVNAVKYSLPDSRIVFDIFHGRNEEPASRQAGETIPHQGDLVIAVVNEPRESQAKTEAAEPIIGIPYDYSELVFDLFFTMDAFPATLEEEDWADGTGLYVVRKLLGRMGALVDNRMIVDYTGGSPRAMVRFAINLWRSKEIKESS